MDEKFQEMLCAAWGVEDEEELPLPVQDIDVVKFARQSPEEVAAKLVRDARALECVHSFRACDQRARANALW